MGSFKENRGEWLAFIAAAELSEAEGAQECIYCSMLEVKYRRGVFKTSQAVVDLGLVAAAVVVPRKPVISCLGCEKTGGKFRWCVNKDCQQKGYWHPQCVPGFFKGLVWKKWKCPACRALVPPPVPLQPRGNELRPAMPVELPKGNTRLMLYEKSTERLPHLLPPEVEWVTPLVQYAPMPRKRITRRTPKVHKSVVKVSSPAAAKWDKINVGIEAIMHRDEWPTDWITTIELPKNTKKFNLWKEARRKVASAKGMYPAHESVSDSSSEEGRPGQSPDIEGVG
jgi:hypothetical protein